MALCAAEEGLLRIEPFRDLDPLGRGFLLLSSDVNKGPKTVRVAGVLPPSFQSMRWLKGSCALSNDRAVRIADEAYVPGSSISSFGGPDGKDGIFKHFVYLSACSLDFDVPNGTYTLTAVVSESGGQAWKLSETVHVIRAGVAIVDPHDGMTLNARTVRIDLSVSDFDPGLQGEICIYSSAVEMCMGRIPDSPVELTGLEPGEQSVMVSLISYDVDRMVLASTESVHFAWWPGVARGESDDPVETKLGRFATNTRVNLPSRIMRRYGIWSSAELDGLSAWTRLGGGVVVEVGTSFGELSIPLAKLVGARGSMHVVEADTRNTALLLQNCELNGLCDRITLHDECVGVHRLPLKRHPVKRTMQDAPLECNHRPLPTLDTWAADIFGRLDLLLLNGASTIDAQSTLAGATSLIMTHSPLIWIADAGARYPQDLVAALLALGYAVSISTQPLIPSAQAEADCAWDARHQRHHLWAYKQAPQDGETHNLLRTLTHRPLAAHAPHMMFDATLAWARGLRRYERLMGSQQGEAGLIDEIFRYIGVTNRYFVDFGTACAWSNQAHLVRYYGWDGLGMEGRDCSDPAHKQELVDADNIMALFTKYNVPFEFDLLNIDIDSNDFWVWQQIDEAKFKARVVVIEVSWAAEPTLALSIKYNPGQRWSGNQYMGATVGAMKILGEKKGYSLIACDRHQINCIFVHDSVLGFHLPFEFEPERLVRRNEYRPLEELLQQGPWIEIHTGSEDRHNCSVYGG
jgi:hypothetical protein